MEQERTMQEDLARWYCVRAQVRREQIAAALLETAEGIEPFCPRIRFRRRTRRGKVWFEEALFPGYLFARFDLSRSLRLVASTPGVRGVVQFGSRTVPVPDVVINTLREEAGREPIVVHETPFQPGDTAVVADGAMRGLKALITRVMPGGERIRILMEIMGTVVEVDLPADSVERVEE